MNDLGFERDIAPLLGAHVRHGYRPGGLRCEISLIQFLMASLRWPEGSRRRQRNDSTMVAMLAMLAKCRN